MGCHTWFYQKVSLSREEAKSRDLQICEKRIKLYSPSFTETPLSKLHYDKVQIKERKIF